MCDMLNLMVSSPSTTGEGNMRTLLCFADCYRNNSATKDSYRVRCRMSGAGFDMIWNSSATETIGTNTSNNNFIFHRDYTAFMNKNVGIGKTSPGAKLVVAESTDTQDYGKIQQLDMQKLEHITMVECLYNQKIRICILTNGGEKMRIAADGNVGIGQTNPTYKLDVNGTGRFTGDLTVGGNITVNGTTTTVSTTNMVVSDSLIELNSGASSNANDCGIVIERGSTGDNAFMGWDESADKFLMGTTNTYKYRKFKCNYWNFVANLEGNLTGSILTAAQTNITSVGTLKSYC